MGWEEQFCLKVSAKLVKLMPDIVSHCDWTPVLVTYWDRQIEGLHSQLQLAWGGCRPKGKVMSRSPCPDLEFITTSRCFQLILLSLSINYLCFFPSEKVWKTSLNSKYMLFRCWTQFLNSWSAVLLYTFIDTVIVDLDTGIINIPCKVLSLHVYHIWSKHPAVEGGHVVICQEAVFWC